jgi:hypothetical protein
LIVSQQEFFKNTSWCPDIPRAMESARGCDGRIFRSAPDAGATNALLPLGGLVSIVFP